MNSYINEYLCLKAYYEDKWRQDMNKQTELWEGDFGDAYLKRNRVDWRARIPFWDHIIQRYGIRSVFEMGTNAGWNFSAIKHSINGYNVECHGLEINTTARHQANMAGHSKIYIDTSGEVIPSFELTFTSGVLIHIAPAELESAMRKLIDCSCDYVMAIEYESEEEEHVNYRGQDGYLWRRPYGQLYQDMGLELIETFKPEGFDNCTAWVLRK